MSWLGDTGRKHREDLREEKVLRKEIDEAHKRIIERGMKLGQKWTPRVKRLLYETNATYRDQRLWRLGHLSVWSRSRRIYAYGDRPRKKNELFPSRLSEK